jgi:pimeloyl-ACP methyl ester carboxylesterase
MAEGGPQVFISYHRADLAVAERVRAHLLAHHLRTWMDHYDIPAGAYWPDEIDQGLNESDLVLGILSPDSAASRNVKNEWDWAIQNDKQLILLMTRPCVIPHRYISINFIDATRDNLDAALDELMRVPELRSDRSELAIPRTRYARSGEVSIAYQVFGDAPVDLVFVPGYISHVEHSWKLPAMAAFLRRLASLARLIIFDKRGTGMSDRLGRVSTLEERMDDIRAVMDACESDQAVIMGLSEGVPLSILFAATHPARTRSLILYSGPATYVRQPDYPWPPTREERQRHFIDEAASTLYETWGTVESAREIISEWGAPSHRDDEELARWFAELLRLGASPGAELERRRMNLEIDVRAVLPAIKAPTLLLNRVGDTDVNIGEARYIAQRIPGAVLTELPGSDHFPMVGDQESLFAAIERFLAGSAPETPAHERETVLATVVHIASEGLDPVDLAAVASGAAARFRGRIAESGDDAVVAVFDGPARAIRFADAVCQTAAARAGSARGGIQTGELEIGDGEASGPPVEVARRLAEVAQPGQLLVTGIVRDLVAGSGIRFEPAPGDQASTIADVAQVLVVDRDSLA